MASIHEVLDQGLKHHLAGELDRAEQLYRQVLGQQPQNANALNLLGTVSLARGQVDDAVRRLEQAVAADPTASSYQINLGSAYLAARRVDDARRVLLQAVHLSPDSSDAHYNLAIANYHLGRMDDAAASYRRAIACNPQEARPHNNLGSLLLEFGQVDLALEVLDRAVQLDPTLETAHYNRGLALLKQGRFAEGWREYEWRPKRAFSQPEWDGSPLAGQTLLVHAEQGFGDTIQLLRYLPLMRARVPRTIAEIPAGLLPLAAESGIGDVFATGSPLPRFDAQLPMASLPRVFATTLETIPASVPYLRARPELVERWKSTLANYPAFKVGIAWQGSPSYTEDRYRSIPLPFFAPLAGVPRVQLFGLQKGPGADQLARLRSEFHVIDLMSRSDEQAGPFMDTAAILANLDLVITSDTVTAHLAGSLGVPVWVALRIGCDWRWLIDRSDCPWYPTMRLFRQRTFGDWPQVIAEMASELARLAR